MNRSPITIKPMSTKHIPEVIALNQAQAQRFHALDYRLTPASSYERIVTLLAQHCQNAATSLVALDTAGRVRAYAHPALWELESYDSLLAFFTERNGITHSLTLPDPDDDDVLAVTEALFSALSTFWQAQRTGSDMLRWPACESWFEALVLGQGFILDSALAYHPARAAALVEPRAYPGLHVRLSQPQDEEVLVKLFEEELQAHQPFTPFVRCSPAIIQAFRDRLALQWAGKRLEAGAPLVLVVERNGELVAMAENELYIWEDGEEPDFMPCGRYGHINNLGVRKDQRGQGIGRLLVQAIFTSLAPFKLDGYILWFNPANPLSNPFWQRLGFRQLWRTYQRPHAEASQGTIGV
ncbi:GNAT family N-acetyltransferase [Ktedonosporobacter rubrisoli]|uniref:GNAT family N-acetyltransferase n=1 Tax=Ktedonosporobacter rubrisoli TaxID=2509675 RepID=A0A4P6K0D4_KTERU|nr:GNAT family N-acetyltransferase [Ktedonosporobacter rubrisoli]QBD81253.1 GNAT family N-acetyltransferase [Ktedonosporobacter rubrisoli]